MDYKSTIIQALDILRKRDLANKEPFKARAYQNVITQLTHMAEPFTSMEQLSTMKGVGEQIKKKIQEIMTTGHLQTAERAKELYSIDSLDAFQNIYGVGPAKATDLVKQGYRTIEQLREALTNQPKLLNDKQTIGLQYYEDLLERIPRAEMDQHRDILLSTIPLPSEIVGSYRRGKENSGDIDVLIRVPEGLTSNTVKQQLAVLVQKLKASGYIEQVLAIGEHKCMAICRLPHQKARRLDLLMTPANEYAYAILYFTGSDRFNVAFRQFALSRGYTLNEHIMTPIHQTTPPAPPMQTEKDIFHFLGLRYINPMNRVDANQILHKKPKVGVDPS
jgi:DNA polymerase/3'-5' exonuclease PolX